MRLRHYLVSLAVVATTALTAVAAAPAASASTAQYPVPYSFTAGLLAGITSPSAPPLGSNNWNCKPTTAHPDPIVLVHGTFANMTDSWQALSPLLANNGYCVFALNYGGSTPGNPIQGTGPIEASAQQLADFVTKVLTATGAAKVDIVGHSQGGMMPRYYIKFLGGSSKVDTLVGLAPSNHGTTLFGLSQLASAFPGGTQQDPFCQACSQQMAGSSFLQHLNANSDPGPPSYTVIETMYDEVVTPYTSAFLPQASNILLQSRCADDFSDHLSIIYDQNALQLVLNALDPAHPSPPPCALVLPVLGG
jgi:pimeloyl-ACP methyl ester carboxylesterase